MTTAGSCKCYTSSCTTGVGFLYAATLPIGVGSVQIFTYYAADAVGCSGAVSYLLYSSGFCFAEACGGSSTAGYYSVTCFGAGKPTFRPTVIPGGVTASPTLSHITLLKVSQVRKSEQGSRDSLYNAIITTLSSLTLFHTVISFRYQDMSCAKCLMSSWGTVDSVAYKTQYSLMVTTIQSSAYAYIFSESFEGNMNITVTALTQKSTSRRQLLTPTLTAAYTGQSLFVYCSLIVQYVPNN